MKLIDFHIIKNRVLGVIISNNNVKGSQPDSHPSSSNSSQPTLTYAQAATNQNTETASPDINITQTNFINDFYNKPLSSYIQTTKRQ